MATETLAPCVAMSSRVMIGATYIRDLTVDMSLKHFLPSRIKKKLRLTSLSVSDSHDVQDSEELVLNTLATFNNLAFHSTKESALMRRQLDIGKGQPSMWNSHVWYMYHQTSNISHTKCQNLNVSCLVLQSFLPKSPSWEYYGCILQVYVFCHRKLTLLWESLTEFAQIHRICYASISKSLRQWFFFYGKYNFHPLCFCSLTSDDDCGAYRGYDWSQQGVWEPVTGPIHEGLPCQT